MKFGAHVSIAGGIDRAPQRAYELDCECFQIFTRSPQGGRASKLNKTVVDSFFKQCSEYRFADCYVHTPYFVNLASDNRDVRISSVNLIKEELLRANLLGVKYVMTHLGSAKLLNRSEAIKNVIEGICRITDRAGISTGLLLENSAGQGATIGSNFEELSEILRYVENPDVGVCLDTAHLYATGYDISTRESVKAIISSFSSIVGLERLKLLHGNDSKAGLGERKDRHEHIGKGQIGIDGFTHIVHNKELKKLDLIVETPHDRVREDIEILKQIRGSKKR